MPVMNGIESTFQIRALEKERHERPAMIVALTGLASAESQQEAFSSGINLFLTKPVRFGDLRKLLGEWDPILE
jgi:CheY-like chemotaxis protein